MRYGSFRGTPFTMSLPPFTSTPSPSPATTRLMKICFSENLRIHETISNVSAFLNVYIELAALTQPRRGPRRPPRVN